MENKTDEAYAARSAYMLKPRGRGPDLYNDAQYDKRGKLKDVVDEEPPRRSRSRMRNIDYEDASEHDEIQEERRTHDEDGQGLVEG